VQIKDEVRAALEFVDYVYKIFGFKYELELSTVTVVSSFYCTCNICCSFRNICVSSREMMPQVAACNFTVLNKLEVFKCILVDNLVSFSSVSHIYDQS
jgi:threonyl-tRNA synthetase